MVRVRLLMLLFMLFAFQSGAFAATDVVVYGDEGYTPYSYIDAAGKPVGIYVEILQLAFSKMPDYNVTIDAVPWKRGLKMLEDGSGFALFPPYYKKERESFIKFSNPILDETVVAFCREEVLKNPRPNWPDDYFGLTVGINAGFNIGGDAFWQAVKDGKIKVEEAADNRSNILKLAMGRIDCYINDRISILWDIKRLKASGEYDENKHQKIVEGAATGVEQGHLGFTIKDNGKFPFRDDFAEKFNAIIEEMKKNGEIQQIVDKFTK